MTDRIGSGGDNPENAAAPTTEATTENDQNKDTTAKPPVKPKSPREVRALQALARGAVLRHVLDGIIGTGNAPEYVRRLRAVGWRIITEHASAIDRDGQKIRIGRYRLAPDQIDIANEMVGGAA